MKPIDIKMLYTALGLNKSDFASRLGVTHVAIKHIEDRKRISKHMIATICAVFPRVSRTYLETGRGEMFMKPDNATQVQDDRHVYRLPENLSADVQEMIDGLIEVMQSEEEETRLTLKQNVKAFVLSVRNAKKLKGSGPAPSGGKQDTQNPQYLETAHGEG